MDPSHGWSARAVERAADAACTLRSLPPASSAPPTVGPRPRPCRVLLPAPPSRRPVLQLQPAQAEARDELQQAAGGAAVRVACMPGGGGGGRQAGTPPATAAAAAGSHLPLQRLVRRLRLLHSCKAQHGPLHKVRHGTAAKGCSALPGRLGGTRQALAARLARRCFPPLLLVPTWSGPLLDFSRCRSYGCPYLLNAAFSWGTLTPGEGRQAGRDGSEVEPSGTGRHRQASQAQAWAHRQGAPGATWPTKILVVGCRLACRAPPP